ncbi:MAG: hypothetical protein JKY56_05905 [Kofleriaceae bacterium]|nr:hypothetical protein [Kofleriaceae bacterium]
MLRWLTLVFLLSFHGSSLADGVSVRHQKLNDIFRQGGLLIRVDKVDGSAVESTVLREWSSDNGSTVGQGQSRSLHLRTRPQPRAGKWVLDRRYWNPRQEALKVGDRVLFVGGFVLNDTPENIRKLDVLAKKDWERQYKREGIGALEKDLSDFDLFEQAYATLKARRALTDDALIAALQKKTIHNVMEHHLDSSSGYVQRRFLLKLVTKVLPHNRALGKALLRLFRNKITRSRVPALLAFLKTLDAKNADEAEAMYDIADPILRYLKTSRKSQATPFIEFFARYAPHKPHAGGADDHIYDFMARLSRKGMSKFLVLMSRELASSKGDLDEFALEIVVSSLPKLNAKSRAISIGLLGPRMDGAHHCSEIEALAAATGKLVNNKRLSKRLAASAKFLLTYQECVDDKDENALRKMAR